MPSPTFTHLHVHSNYTFMSGAATLGELLDRAQKQDMRALALTDRNGLYGAIHFYKAARERGVQPILGTELDDPGDPAMRAVLLAENRRGFGRICRLITRRKLNQKFRLAEELAEIPGDVILLTDHPALLQQLSTTLAADQLYGELIPPADDDGRKRVKRLIAAARKGDIPLVAANDVYLARGGDHPPHRLLRAIGTNRTLFSLDGEEQACPHNYLASSAEMSRAWQEIPEAVANTETIRERCLIELEPFGFMVTRHPLELLGPQSWLAGVITADRMRGHAGRQARMIGWMITAKRITARKTGQPMKFMSMEDLTGTFEVTLFPDVYRKHAHQTLGHGPDLVTGKVEDHYGSCSLTADAIEIIGKAGFKDMRI